MKGHELVFKSKNKKQTEVKEGDVEEKSILTHIPEDVARERSETRKRRVNWGKQNSMESERKVTGG